MSKVSKKECSLARIHNAKEGRMTVVYNVNGSSTIKSLAYSNGTLSVKFHSGEKTGAFYNYFFVPKEVYEKLVKAESVGSAFASLVKDKYSFSKEEPKRAKK